MLNFDRFSDDAFDSVGVRSSFEVREEEASEVGVESFISGDKFVLYEGRSKSARRPPWVGNRMRRTEKVSPGMRPRFLSQKIEAKDPEKKIPSTAAKATRRSPKTDCSSLIHLSAQSAFLAMQGTGRRGDDGMSFGTVIERKYVKSTYWSRWR